MTHDNLDSVKKDVKITVVGIGEFAGALMNSIQFPSNPFIRLVYLDRKNSLIFNNQHIERIELDDPSTLLKPDDPLETEREFRTKAHFFDPIVITSSIAIFFSSLGGSVSPGVLPVLINRFTKAGVPSFVFYICPDPAIEGRIKCLVAKNCLSDLHSAGAVTVCLGNSSSFTGDTLRDRIFAKFQSIINIIFEQGLIPIDISQVLQMFDQEEQNAFSHIATQRNTRLSDVVDLLLSDPDVMCFRGKEARLVLHILTDKSFTLFELDEIASAVTDRWGAETDLTYGAKFDQAQNEIQLSLMVCPQRTQDENLLTFPAIFEREPERYQTTRAIRS